MEGDNNTFFRESGMSHEIEVVNGKASMVYFGEVPWHKLGNPLTEAECTDLEACRVKAGADWLAEKVRLMTSDTNTPVDAYAVRRCTDKKILGTVGPRYTILQNRDAFDWFKPFIESGEAVLHTAGVLREGSRIWVLAKLNREEMEIAKGDTVQKFILLSHSHDGTLAVRAGFTPIRTVCANTLAMAHSNKASKLIRCKHSKSVKLNLERIRETMNAANAEFEATAEQYRGLCRKDVNQKDLEKFVRIVFKKEDEEELHTRTANQFSEIYELFETGKGNTLPGVRGTLWAAYNAVTEYLAYSRGNSDDTRMDSLWYGDSSNINKLALETALTMAS